MSESKNIITFPSLETIEAEAAAWLTALGRQHVPPEELARFKAWLTQSERHRKAFSGMSALWEDLEVLKDLADIDASTLPHRPDRALSRRQIIAAAACVPAAIVTGIAIAVYRERWINERAEFATQIGEQKTVKLADGSLIQLNTNSLVREEYSEEARNIWLLQGEAYFDVAKNPRRPFSVFAANGVVRAIGTAFTVKLQSDKTFDVTVAEGRVALSAENSGVSVRAAAELTAYQSAVFAKKVERVAQLKDHELTQKLAWRQGILAYTGVPLSDVVADVSRYTDIKIEIVDPVLRSKRVGGIFRVGELDALFDSLQLTFGLKVEHAGPKLIRISQAT